VSWWPFEGNTNDFYAANNGAPSGNPAFVSGKVGQALYFDGLDDQVKVTASGSTNVGAGSGFTIEMWINPQDVAAQRPLIEWGNAGSVGVHLWISVPLAGGGPGSLFVNMKNILGGDALMSSAPSLLAENSYQHVALTYRKDGLAGITTLYLNGSVVAGPLDLGAFPQTSYDLYFGVRPSSAGSRFLGQMDEIGLFNRELSQGEIQSIYNSGTAGKCKTRYVTNTNDGGPGSLRQALTDSNIYNAPNTIAFNIQPAGGVKTIIPASQLFITGPVVIDGSSQPGFAGAPIIELNGSQAGPANGFECQAPVTIKGFVIDRFAFNGIDLFVGSSGSVIVGNYIGTNAQGNVAAGNSVGVRITGPNPPDPVSNIRIGGTTQAERNIISGNSIGIQLSAATSILIQGNFIGTDVTGTSALGNANEGILWNTLLGGNSGNNTIGGTAGITPGGPCTGACNLIAGNGFNGISVSVTSSNNLIQGNYIGTNVSGTQAIANAMYGIDIRSVGNQIGGTTPAGRNVISGNENAGLHLTNNNNVVQGNLIGTNVSGTNRISNGGPGIEIAGSNNQIGGTVAGARNLVSGNTSSGIVISGGNNLVQGNYIGTDITGTVDLGNGSSPFGDGINISGPNNTIGGTVAGARNIISGNSATGVYLNSNANLVQGNYIGTDVTGAHALGNSEDGVGIPSGSGNQIGGTTSGARNVISGNFTTGIQIANTATQTLVQGNYIGTDATGTMAIGNGWSGVLVLHPASNNTIGGTSGGAGNRIAFNGIGGVFVNGGSDINRNAIRGNSIFANVGLGIDLTPSGITPNDPGDFDTGANNLQNFPVLTSAVSVGGNVTIQGTLNSTPNESFQIELFGNSACDASNNGEGQMFLGPATVGQTDFNGNGSFSLVLPSASLSGSFISATATDSNGNTSEFSQCIQVTGTPTPTPTPTPNAIQFTSATFNISEGGGSAAIGISRSGDTSASATVNYRSSDPAGLTNCNVVNGTASSRCDYATAVGQLRFDPGQTLKSISIPIIDDSYAEGGESFTITLSNVTGATLGSPNTATVTIADNETVNGLNPIDGTAFFVREQYIDFLNREPDPAGYAAWQQVINSCPQGDTTCDRIHVSSAFFRSPEFQDRGYFVYRFYPVSFGRKPDYVEFVPDLAKVSGFLSDAELEAAKVAFIAEFMSRPAFMTKFNGLNDTQYVDTLLSTAQVTSPNRDFWIAALGNGTRTRATVLRDISESPEVYNKYYNQAFVVMQYFGYLRRDPDSLYLNWIMVLDTTGDFRGMVNGFMNSLEYRFRFGP
jgi:hypothetical protein